MSANTTQSKESDGGIDERTERALTEYMTVLDEGGDIYTVVGENENGEYQVDNRKGRCSCPDHKHRSARCKHIRRVAFATGDEAIPSGVEGVDPQLGDHVDSEPTTTEAASGDSAVATDGGVVAANVNDTEPPADARISIADTGAGLLVFEADAEFRDHLDREVVVSKELAGFADVDDWSAIRDALRARGLGVGAVTHLPVFDVDELPDAEVGR